MELLNFYEKGYKCKECDFFTTTDDEMKDHILESHQSLLPKKQKFSEPMQFQKDLDPNKDKKWKDLFHVTLPEATETMLGSLDHETFLACRLVCQGWREAVNKYKPTWKKIRGASFQDSLLSAILQGNKLVTEMLISCNAANRNIEGYLANDFSKIPVYKGTPLHFAAKSNNPLMVEMLISIGADVNSKDINEDTPLHIASTMNNPSMVEILLSNGAHVNSKDGFNQSPLKIAARFGYVDIARYLLNHGAHVEFDTLHVAVNARNSPVVELLISNGNCVDLEDGYKESLLVIASRLGHSEIVSSLLKYGARVDFRHKNDETALHCAAARGHLSVAELLLAHGASVNCQNTSGNSPLHEAVLKEDNVKVAALLCSHGASVNMRNTSGNTPLHLTRNEAMVNILCSYGGNLNARNVANKTPLEMAEEAGLLLDGGIMQEHLSATDSD